MVLRSGAQATVEMSATGDVIVGRIMIGRQVVSFDLGGGCGKHIDIHGGGSFRQRAPVWTQVGGHVRDVIGVRMRRGHVGRGDLRHGRGSSHGFGWWTHQVRGRVCCGCGFGCVGHGGSSQVLGLGASPRIRIVVNPRMASEFVGTTESLGAAWVLACMWFFSGVRANVSCLVF